MIVGNAIIWAAVLLGGAFVLGGTDCYSQVSTVLAGGAAASIVVVGGGVRRVAGD